MTTPLYSSQTHRLFCATLLFSLLVSLPVSAHEDPPVEEVLVEGRWDDPTGALSSASQGVVGQIEIDARPRLRTGEILEVVPGLIVTQHSGTGKSNQMFLRGFNLDHGTDFATWVDGMPVNMPTHGHGQGYTDLNFLIPELVKSLEYRKGPYYAEVSDFSSAGAALLSIANRLPKGIAKIGAGEDGYLRGLVANSVETGDGDFLYALQAHYYDGPWVGVKEDLDRYNGLLRYSQSTESSEWNLTFMAYDAKWNSADQVPLRAVTAGQVSALGTIDDTVGGASSRYSLSGSWHRDFAAGRIRARGYVIDYELDLFSNFTYFLDDPINGDQFRQVDDRNVYGSEISWQMQRGDATHTFGLMTRFDNIGEVGLFRTARRQLLSTVRRDKVRQLSLGLYYDYDVKWSSRWRGSFGVRADYFDFDVHTSTIEANTGTESEALLAPRFNIIYAPNRFTELYASAGRAFHSNDARGTTISVDPVSGDPAEPVDPLVKSNGAELGLRLFRDRRVSVSAALWYLELDSELLFVGDAGNTEASRPSRRYGLEIPVYYRPNDVWSYDVELALTNSGFTDADPAGDDIPGALDRVISAGISAQFPDGFYGSLRVRHFDERPLLEDSSVVSEASTVFNLSLGHRSERLDLRVDVLNLFDEKDDDITYFYESRLRGEAVGVEDIHFHPMEPRAVRASITWRF
ncbi:MAG: TonB-dependent receptor [Gammaproteobacteria bacterium]|nr:TonB-dependent receptor [Gammaproteobacteria bacterium]